MAGPTDQPVGRAVITYRWPFKMAAEVLQAERPDLHVQRLKELLGLVTALPPSGSGRSTAEPS